MTNSDFEKINNSKTTKQNLSKSGVSKPSIELTDFYEYLDPKVVERIKQTSEEDKARIVSDVEQYEYDMNGAQNILDYLKK